jgi:hypothetical protein
MSGAARVIDALPCSFFLVFHTFTASLETLDSRPFPPSRPPAQDTCERITLFPAFLFYSHSILFSLFFGQRRSTLSRSRAAGTSTVPVRPQLAKQSSVSFLVIMISSSLVLALVEPLSTTVALISLLSWTSIHPYSHYLSYNSRPARNHPQLPIIKPPSSSVLASLDH